MPEAYFAPDAILAALAYAAQIYCDFSGYTDIAIGLALLLGFVFPQNFNSPYRATGFRDFWRRWHMTLSRFLRDYLYIPLGGSRGQARWFTYRNLMLTMLLGGLWHGAAWTFVLWGGFHGAGLVAEHAIDGRIGRRTPVWLRWALAPSSRSASAGSSSARPTSTCSARSSGGSSTRGRRRSSRARGGDDPHRDRHAAAATRARSSASRCGSSGCVRSLLAVGLAVVILIVGATVPSQGVPPSSTFSSDEPLRAPKTTAKWAASTARVCATTAPATRSAPSRSSSSC